MNLAQYVDSLHRELMTAAEAGGEEARVLAERLTTPLESATRLVMLEALSDAANEITRELAPGSVDVRLRGRDPEFVVTSRPVGQPFDDVEESPEPVRSDVTIPATDVDEGGTSRLTLRLPEQLKVRIEEAAGSDGLSVNAWLVRAVGGALEPAARAQRHVPRGPIGGQRYSGWVQ